ncbi:Outer membrane protein (porin) [Marinospirillum celere]|uniref:Outer membrane protein (Porin) n=1 Tax=Marinospirillum celere TaxID=1122252 RepID=A0A1I1GX92_9GAMM|nr:porin [Marinospirillum celere]SFC13590.1 Outer membrane protein (porin) [Marinospirillum celere]
MKKTLLASAVVASLAAGAAQAATIYESDNGNTKVDSYGRVITALVADDGDNSIDDLGSRIGFRASDKINDDLTAFARVEFRFQGDERRRGSDTGNDRIFNDLRNTYVGVQGDFGKVTFGNFDSIYFQSVSHVMDLFENAGYRALNAGSQNARGDTVAFETADLGGMQFGVSAKHYAEGATNSGDEEWNLMAYGEFTMIDNLTFAVAFDQNNEDAEGGEDPILGASASYSMDDLTASVLFETSGDLLHLAAGGSYAYGSGDLYGMVSFLDDGDENGLDIAVGANYKFSRAFRTFGELAVGNDKVSGIGDKNIITVGARYDW